MKGKSTQKVVKIDEGLWDKLDSFLKTDVAKNIGYHSKAQFTTESVRNKFELIEKKYIIVSMEFMHESKNQIFTLKEIHKDEIKTYKNQIKENMLTIEKLKKDYAELRTEYRMSMTKPLTDKKIIEKINSILEDRKIKELD